MAEHGKLLTSAKEDVTTANGTIKTLQDTVKKFDGVDVEAKARIWQTLKQNITLTYQPTKLNYALEARLAKEGAVNSKAVKALLDGSKISLDGDNLIGVDEQLKALKESEKWAFSQPTPDVPGAGGNPPPTTQTKAPLPTGTVIF